MRFVMNPWLFTALVFVVGCGMGIGKAAVYKYIPEYFPKDVGAVGGLVGLLGALGGFFLPPMFSWAWAVTGVPQTTFGILLAITAGSFLWLHLVVLGIMHRAAPHMEHVFEESRPAALLQPQPDTDTP
jgi:NNP family nitrate/nitrite transporter-like MFS transporter